MRGYFFVVREQVLQQDLYYKGYRIMTYTIKYPEMISDRFQILAEKLSALYRARASMYEKSTIHKLYQQAMVEYEYSIANDFPIREFEVYMDYKVTYNQNCTLSLYFDQYEYTGGAHGLTTRSSDNWNLQKSRRMELKDLFIVSMDTRGYVISKIESQIEEQIAAGDDLYFENYPQLVRENFKPNNFYLSEEGAVFYFQQYDIAPYAAGIRTFLIPYDGSGIAKPRCCY
jgi:hypothetical protein